MSQLYEMMTCERLVTAGWHWTLDTEKQNEAQSARAHSTHKDVRLEEFMYNVFTRLPGQLHQGG